MGCGVSRVALLLRDKGAGRRPAVRKPGARVAEVQRRIQWAAESGALGCCWRAKAPAGGQRYEKQKASWSRSPDEVRCVVAANG